MLRALAEHDERSWGMRLHLPLQLFEGSVRAVVELASFSAFSETQ